MTEKRAIFEEVGKPASEAPTPTGGVIDAGKRGARGPIRAWLVVLFLLVTLMVVVGGLTRLTDSGLSITEWRPVTGAMPPLSEAAWLSEFEKYKKIPEYQLQNKGMSLEEFKFIYWWEWGHRQLGRFVGLVWGLGFLWFLLRRQIPVGWTKRLLWIGGLGGLQGAIGWWMVASGLTGEMLDVASYRLVTHLGLATVILGYITWYIMLLGRSEADLLQARRGRERKLFGMGTGLLHLSFVQILLGAMVAGIDAGRSFAEWPLMGGQFFPPGAFDLEPLWRNFFENAGLVQFIHRIVGYILLIFALVVWRVSRRSPNRATKRAFDLVAVIIIAQAILGVMTLLTGAHLHVALTHQIGAIVSFVLILSARFGAGYPARESIKA